MTDRANIVACMLFLALLSICAGPSLADPPQQPRVPQASLAGPPSYLRVTSVAGGTDHRGFLTNRSLITLAGLGTAVLVSKRYENPEYMVRKLDDSPLEGAIDLGDMYGEGWVLGPGALGLLAAGRLTDNRRFSATGRDLSRSLLMTWGVVWALKVSVNAQRPNGGAYSFPSGHTATAFAAAPVLMEHYGWRIGVPAYALAAMTGMGRMEDRRHYLSDVLAGAAIGLVVGHEVVRRGEGGGLLDHIIVNSRGIGVSLRY